MNRLILAWSGGKDSALALRLMQSQSDISINSLLTTITEEYERISMHGVRIDLLHRQARALGLPVDIVCISPKADDQEYRRNMAAVLIRHQQQGVSGVVFGDIFLEDVRAYREANLAEIGMQAVFPLWKRDTRQLAQEFIASGFKAIVTCIDGDVLPQSFVGRSFDRQFLADLPAPVDPCGENGEFHTFVFDGPIFHYPVSFCGGEVVLRDNRFYYYDLVPVEEYYE